MAVLTKKGWSTPLVKRLVLIYRKAVRDFWETLGKFDNKCWQQVCVIFFGGKEKYNDRGTDWVVECILVFAF